MTLRDKAIHFGKNKFYTRECSMCNYKMSYRVIDNDYNVVVYDAGCNCVTYHGIHESSWEALENFYNLQSDEGKASLDRMWWGTDAS